MMKRLKNLKQGNTYFEEISDQCLKNSVEDGEFVPTTDSSVIGDSDVVVICVPTPLNEDRSPNADYIEDVAGTIADHLREDQLIVLESTTYPGTSSV